MERPIPEIDGVEVEHRFLDVGDIRMHVAIAGPEDAEPVVLLHGWPEHWYAWRRVIPTLAERYRVYAPDLRGFGWTDAPAGPYLKATFASDTIALLDALGLERVRLAGHDWGGFAGFLVCLDAPERVSHYLAAAISHPWIKPEPGIVAKLKGLGRLYYQVLLAAPGLGRAIVRRPALMTRVMRGSAADPERTWASGELDTFVDQWREPERAAVTVSLYRTFLTKELAKLASGAYAARSMETPSVLVAAGQDRVIKPQGLGGFEENAPNLRIEVIEESGHWIPDEAPERLTELMLDLFAQPG